jgi:hypothetical protein
MTSAITFDEPRSKRRCLRGWFLLAAAFVLLAHVSPAQAAFVLDMTVQNATVSAGGAGSFDVVLRNDASATQSVSIAGFSIDLTIPSGTGISLTGANDLTSAPYIFAGNSLGFLAAVTATEVQANDFAAASGTLLAPGGATVGLAHITLHRGGGHALQGGPGEPDRLPVRHLTLGRRREQPAVHDHQQPDHRRDRS